MRNASAATGGVSMLASACNGVAAHMGRDPLVGAAGLGRSSLSTPNHADGRTEHGYRIYFGQTTESHADAPLPGMCPRLSATCRFKAVSGHDRPAVAHEESGPFVGRTPMGERFAVIEGVATEVGAASLRLRPRYDDLGPVQSAVGSDPRRSAS
jgi:hypothetical protein